MDTKKFPKLIKQLYDIVEELEDMTAKYPGGKRHFTLDGHIVGSMGEVLAMYHYGIELYSASTETHDGRINSREVQIKATQSDDKNATIGVRSAPQFLLVLKIDKEGKAEEIYNGPGKFIKEIIDSRKRPSNGQYQIRLGKLRKLMTEVADEDKIERVNP